MKRVVSVLVALVLMVSLCASALAAVTPIVVTSKSIKDGKLLTVTAAKNKYNAPKGANKSPQLTWTTVADAKFYVVVMYDQDVDWLHWFKRDIKAKKGEAMSLKQGAFTKTGVYIGPYPPAPTRHTYKIEVFALAKKPGSFKVKMNSGATSYDAIVKGLDTVKGQAGNIIGRGYVLGSYAHGDNTKK